MPRRGEVCVRGDQRQIHHDENSMQVTMGERRRAARKAHGMRHVHRHKGHTTLHGQARAPMLCIVGLRT
jgi:hypothetical protein